MVTPMKPENLKPKARPLEHWFTSCNSLADKAVRVVSQLAYSPAWQGLFEAQRSGVWCHHDLREEALTKHVQALVMWKAVPSECLHAIDELFFIPSVRLLTSRNCCVGSPAETQLAESTRRPYVSSYLINLIFLSFNKQCLSSR